MYSARASSHDCTRAESSHISACESCFLFFPIIEIRKWLLEGSTSWPALMGLAAYELPDVTPAGDQGIRSPAPALPSPQENKSPTRSRLAILHHNIIDLHRHILPPLASCHLQLTEKPVHPSDVSISKLGATRDHA